VRCSLLAKPKQTMVAHLRDCLLAFGYYRRVNSPVIEKKVVELGYDPNAFWNLAAFAVAAHDWGKATCTWQNYIKRGQGRRITHALFSAAVAADAMGNMGKSRAPDQRLLLAAFLAILSHHQQLYTGAFTGEGIRALGEEEICLEELKTVITDLQEASLNLAVSQPVIRSYNGARLIGLVENLRRGVATLIKGTGQILAFKAIYCLLRQILCLCDNEASAYHGSGAVGPWAPEKAHFIYDHRTTFANFAGTPAGANPNPMQQRVRDASSPFLVLQAGCGSGKTGAALHYGHWLFSQGLANRLIFTLPTQFTSNSMYWDFSKSYGLPPAHVGLYHSEIEEVLRREAEDRVEDPGQYLQDQRFQNSFFNKPVTVATVDHLLYSLLHCHRFADRAFGNLVTAGVIFDEIHYYDTYTLQKIGQCLEILRRLRIPHLVMSATIPASFKEELQAQGQRDGITYQVITAGGGGDTIGTAPDVPFIIKKARAPLVTGKGEVGAELLELLADHLQCRQMVVVNQVEAAKGVARAIGRLYPRANLVCYHSEFTRRDRNRKEKLIKALFRPSVQRSPEEKHLIRECSLEDTDQVILVSTQVCELSLDISADVLYTQVAPADSIVQRGGRLHRRGKAPHRSRCGCDYCREREYLNLDYHYRLWLFPLPWEDRWSLLPYVVPGAGGNILQASWENITDEDEYSFPRVQEWVDRLYPEPPWLRDTEMLNLVLEDAVFGRRPRERFGAPDQGESQGSFRARQSSYASYTVLPGQLVATGTELTPEKIKELGVRVGWPKLKRWEQHLRREGNVLLLDLPYTWEYGFLFPGDPVANG
jgi:CRISPR-associated endonuclease/helicase Cas3